MVLGSFPALSLASAEAGPASTEAPDASAEAITASAEATSASTQANYCFTRLPTGLAASVEPPTYP